MALKDVKHIITVSTTSSIGCQFCDDKVGNSFEDRVNHFLGTHGFELLHVGSEDDDDGKGGTWHGTMAVVGAPAPPPPPKRNRFLDAKLPAPKKRPARKR